MSTKRKYMAVVLAGCMIISSAVPAAAANEKEATAKKAEIQSQINSKKDKIQSLTKLKKEVMSSIRALDEKHTNAQNELESLNKRIDKKTGEIEANTENLKIAEADAKRQYGDMKKRIQYMYESGDQSMLTSILESGSFVEVLNKAEFFQKMTSFDRDKLEEYKKTCKTIEDLEVKLKKEKSDLEGYKVSAEKEKATIEDAISQKQSQISGFESGINAAMAEQADLEGDLAIQNQILQQMKEEVQETAKEQPGHAEKPGTNKPGTNKPEANKPEANKPAPEPGKPAPEPGKPAPEPGKPAPEPGKPAPEPSKPAPEPSKPAPEPSKPAPEKPDTSAPSIGKSLSWPCPASRNITSPFGPRNAPTAGASTYHKGIDISAGTGSAIVAAASGTVIAATYSESSGNYVTISHGSGLSTVYMHATELYVKAGQKVSAGQKIASVGSTGYSTGPHLHFGVMVNGAYVNPMNYY